MDGVFETQPDRTDLPLVVMPVVIESMIGPFKQNFTMLENVARVRMYEDFTGSSSAPAALICSAFLLYSSRLRTPYSANVL